MANPFDAALPSVGQKPWTLNPAIIELRGRQSTVEDVINTGRLSPSGLADEIAAAAATIEANDATVADLISEPTSDTSAAIDAKITPLADDVSDLNALTTTGRLGESELSATIDGDARPARSAHLHPFASTSPWNVAIGTGATYEASSAPQTADFLSGPTYVNSNNGYSIPVAVASGQDSLATVSIPSASRSYTHKVPASAVISTGTDKNFAVIDGVYFYDYWNTTKTGPGAYSCGYGLRAFVTGDGITKGIRASGFPTLGGLIRSHEIDALDIPHALAIALAPSKMHTGPVWPALTEDSDSASTYTGQVHMGALFAIPPSVDLTTPGATTPIPLGLSAEGLALARALQDYGGYVADTAIQNVLYADPAIERDMPAAWSRLNSDWTTIIRPLLRRVTNASQTNVGGPGDRRRPKAAPVAVVSSATRGDVERLVTSSVSRGQSQALALRPDPLFQYAARNIVMATPPTISESGTATITGQVINARTDARIRSLSGVLVQSTDGNWIQTRGPRKTDGTFDNGVPDYWFSIEFMVDASAIEFRIYGLANKYVLTVDGERHTATNGQIANTGASRWLKFDFGGRKADGTARRVQFSMLRGQLREINIGATDTLFKVQARPAPKVAVLSDSYGTGFATRDLVSAYDGYVQHLARLLGCVPVQQNSASNTGYIATNGATAGTYASRVADIISLAPEIVVVQGSINDYLQTAVDVGAAAASVFASLSAALPNSIRIATGILDARVQSQQGTDAAQNAAIQAAAEANGFTYIETGGWVTGNGFAGAATGGGNSDVYTHSDQTHYTTRGGYYLASRLAGEIRSTVPLLP